MKKLMMISLIVVLGLAGLSLAQQHEKEEKAWEDDKPKPRMRAERQNREGRRERDGRGGRGRMKKRFEQEKEQFTEWLGENYPQEAVELEKAEDSEPDIHRQKMFEMLRKYGPIYKASKNNPELAEILKQDMQLRLEVDDVVDKIKQTEDADEKAALKEELADLTGQRFDLIVKRKELQYKDMQAKLEKLQKEITERKTALESLKNNRQTEIDTRVNELLDKSETIQWD